ncbi:HAD family hydrolase [Pontiella agarivorans]|uniref:phosphoglycolate phosphatase n=1 Tax=Pontiella agarivorans TaxID=3038953 RepID=A0ABU5N091_9BACT|nr:HAD family hydrolase [Pontiella agarivorans]MDZ8119856.1 HAD family hydrolase [Pontiella agarivorans]
MQNRFIFCDIDGTLLYAKGSGRPAFGAAFFDVYGVEISVDHINFAGATDLGVLARLARENRQELSEEKTALFFERMAVYLDENMRKWPPIVFPGVGRFLERVSSHWKLGLVSGNIRRTAYLKLRHGGLEHYFSDIGGFGDDNSDRNRMAALALERAGQPSGSFLLGDTPSDIEAARVNGMTSVAVCNGQFTREMLEGENPDIIVDSFEDAEHLFQALDV